MALDKYQVAMTLADEGKTNAEILTALHLQFGSGVATQQLARYRRTTVERLRERKLAILIEVLRAGGTPHMARKRMLDEMGSACGNGLVAQARERLALETVSDETPEEILDETPDDAIVEVDLPDEILEEIPEEAATLVVSPPKPNGIMDTLREIQGWMQSINAENLQMTADGRLSVLVRHEFDLGDLS